MGDEHLDTISTTESDEVIKSSVEDLVLIPSEFEEATEIVIPEVEEIEDNNLREKLLNVHLLIANIEALKDNTTHSFEFLTESSFTYPKSFLEHSDISLPDYEAFSFNNDHIKEISSGNTTTHSNISLSEYDSFTFDLSNDQCPPTDRSDFANEEFVDELAHIISPPEYDCFYFWNLPDPGELISIFNFGIRKNLSITCVNLPIEDDHSLLLAYVVWIFLAYLTYPVIPPYLHSFRNKDTIFDPGIIINRIYSFKPGLSHWYGAFKKFNTHLKYGGIRVKHRDLKQALRGSLLHLAGSQLMLKSSHKAEASVIISIPPLVGGVADVVVEIKGTGKRKTRKRKNRIKTGQKREAWRSREKSKAVTVKRARKTEENAKRRAKNANPYKVIKEIRKKGAENANISKNKHKGQNCKLFKAVQHKDGLCNKRYNSWGLFMP
nr:hypothetical protein [Tanacetum cinerariifolium]